MAGYTPSRLRVFTASMRVYAADLIALYGLWGFLLVRMSIPAFMIATAWGISRIASPSSLTASLGYLDYTAYAALGFAFFGMLAATLFDAGEKLHREMVQGTLEIVMATPASRAAWLLGNAAGGLMLSLVDVALVIVYYTAVFGSESFNLAGAPLAAVSVAIGVVAMTGLGILLGGLVINLKEPHAFNVLLTPFIMLLSGMMFPVEILPQPLAVASQALPLTHVIESVRASLLRGAGFWEIAPHLGILAVEAVIYSVAGYALFTALERRALKNGDLVKY